MSRGPSRSGVIIRSRSRGVVSRRIWAIVVVAAVLFTLYGTPQAAWAHNVLIGTTPGDGTQVKVAPATVVLTFNEPAIATGTKMIVTGPAGSATVGDPVLIDNTVRQSLQSGLPAGEYTVEWRVTSADGHPINGSFSFQAKAGSAPDVPSTAGPSASPPAAPSSATGTNQPATNQNGRHSGWLWLLAVIPIGLAAALGWRFRRR